MTNIYGQYADNPSARAIINHALQKAKQERYGGYWTRKVEELTGEYADRGPEDTGMEMEKSYQE